MPQPPRLPQGPSPQESWGPPAPHGAPGGHGPSQPPAGGERRERQVPADWAPDPTDYANAVGAYGHSAPTVGPVAPAGLPPFRGSVALQDRPRPATSSRPAAWRVGVATIAGLVALSLLIFAAFQGGLIPGVSPSTTPTTARTSSSTTAVRRPHEKPLGVPGPDQKVFIPPVPAPAETTDRTFTSPDRPQPPIPPVKPAGFVAAPAGAGVARYQRQKLSWSACGTAQCATVAAPLDYAKPDGQAITLALLKVPATVMPRKGTIFVNPGGPGEPGTGLAKNFARKGLEMYDIVGWDPRGTGASTPVVCHNGPEIDALQELDNTPSTAAQEAALVQGYRTFGAGCLEKSGALLQHIATPDTAADLELLRQLVGDAQLNYLGYSYGTYIGAVYAEKYPDKVGRLVLDSAVNITLDESIVQASGFDLALNNYADYCVVQRCTLGSSRTAVLATITGLLDRLDGAPLQVGARKLTQSLALTGIAIFLYQDESSWRSLTSRIDAALKNDGAGLLQSADALNGRNSNGTYDPSFFAFPAIGCADSQDDGIARAKADWASDTVKAPIFGKYFGLNAVCLSWPVQGVPPFDITAQGAKPIVVIGATGDSATPYPYAVWMAEQLASGVLVTFDGHGHATYGNDRSACVDQAVVSYFADDLVPPHGLFCS